VRDDSSIPGRKSAKIDISIAHSPRIWNYWLGGKDNYPVDREVGDQFVEIFPDIVEIARASLPSGSHLVVADGTNVIRGESFEQAIAIWNEAGSIPYHLRPPKQIARFFDGLELLEPGVVSCPRWRPEPSSFGAPAEVGEFCAVGLKP
jgi:hypothetical protein